MRLSVRLTLAMTALVLSAVAAVGLLAYYNIGRAVVPAGLIRLADQAKARPNGRVLIFRMGGRAKLPAFRKTMASFNIPNESFSKAQVDEGRFIFTDQCARCHGHGGQSAGVTPDLRRSAALSDAATWRAITIDGALEPLGMISFRKWYSPEQMESVRAYVALKAKIAADRDRTAGRK